METTQDFDGETFRQESLAIRQQKREALTEALVDLETAAWSRNWAGVKSARVRIEALTGITITGPLKRELEKARKSQEAPDAV
jgi:hypothetical protein